MLSRVTYCVLIKAFSCFISISFCRLCSLDLLLKQVIQLSSLTQILLHSHYFWSKNWYLLIQVFWKKLYTNLKEFWKSQLSLFITLNSQQIFLAGTSDQTFLFWKIKIHSTLKLTALLFWLIKNGLQMAKFCLISSI